MAETKMTDDEVTLSGGLFDATTSAEVDAAIKNGANIDEPSPSGVRPIEHFIKTHRLDALIALLRYKPSLVPAKGGYGLLGVACGGTIGYMGKETECPGMITVLVRAGIDVNQVMKENGRDTPLHSAMHSGRMNDVNELITNGANPDLINNHGRDALSIALLHNRLDYIAFALHDPKKGYLKHKTCLFNARSFKALKMLLDAGVPTDVVDQLGNTPLHRVDEWHNADKVRAFMINAVPQWAKIKNKEGLTASQVYTPSTNSLDAWTDIDFTEADPSPDACGEILATPEAQTILARLVINMYKSEKKNAR